MAFRLCVMMNEPNPDVMLSRLTAKHIAEWKVYFDISSGDRPPPAQSSDQIKQTLGNILGR